MSVYYIMSVYVHVITYLKMIGICLYPVSREFHLIQTGKGEVLGRENTPHEPKSDTAIHQILNTGCQSVREFVLPINVVPAS